jgi:SAM-dependent methyltransferase
MRNPQTVFCEADLELFHRGEPGEIRLSKRPVLHRNSDYDADQFPALLRMQETHFWYRGRHRFLFSALREHFRRQKRDHAKLRAIDLGGGCGAWLAYLHRRAPNFFDELALADSSLDALNLAKSVVGEFADRYQSDLYDLGWKNRWDVVFLLDVLEHLHDDAEALRQIHGALRPGGVLFVTVPALSVFHSYNDDLVHHLRRYSRADFAELASGALLQLRRSRYFMFFLSPLLLVRRWRSPAAKTMSPQEIRTRLARTHAVPPALPNQILRAIFSLETPLGWHVPFPWGTSILGVFEKTAR